MAGRGRMAEGLVKILLTGATPMQTNPFAPRVRLKRESFPRILAEQLRVLGHEVVTARMDGSVNPYDFDLTLLGLGDPEGLAPHYLNQALALIGNWHVSPFPLAVYMDDWQMGAAMPKFDAYPRKVDAKTNGLGRYGGMDYLNANRPAIVLGARAASAGAWPPFLLSRFPWGSADVMRAQGRMQEDTLTFSLDPSAFYELAPWTETDPREFGWTCLRLQKRYDTWIKKAMVGADWPLIAYGNARNGEPVIAEDEVPQVFGRYTGTLIPATVTPGSGVWRPRYLLTAYTVTPAVGDPAEVGELGDAWRVTVPDVEALGHHDRVLLAMEQAWAVTSRLWTADQFRETLSEAIHAARQFDPVKAYRGAT